MSSRQTRRRGLVIALSLVAASIVAPSATAQFGGQTGFAEAFKADYLRRDMTIFNEYLQLEDWQRPIVESLLDDYTASFKGGVESVREEMRGMKDQIASGGQRAMEIIMQPIEAWTAEKNQLSDDFLINVKSQLSEQQLENWPRFERAMRREKLLHRGELSGESVNLIGMLNQLQLPPDVSKSVEPLVASYETQLDDALVSREAVIEAVQPRVKDAMVNMDFDAGIAAMGQIMAARVQVREVQDASANAMYGALPTEYGSEFITRYRESAYGKIYRPTSMDRVFAAAKGLEDLTPDQLTSIEQVEIGYYDQLDAINLQLVDLLRAEEPKEARRKAESIRARQTGGKAPSRDDDAMKPAYQQREQLASTTREQLKAILTPEQYAMLPPEAKRRERSANAARERAVRQRESRQKGDARRQDSGKRTRDNLSGNGRSAPGLGRDAGQRGTKNLDRSNGKTGGKSSGTRDATGRNNLGSSRSDSD